ncbi:MAG: sigma-70 family RNA polymerase sigma factor [Oscillospiraceae bacterium]
MDVELYNYIKKAQDGNQDAMLSLLEKFNPLIKKFAYLLKEDDSVQYFTLSFIETVHKINLSGFGQYNAEYAILYYIKKSIQNAYYIAAKKKSIVSNNTSEFKDDLDIPFFNQDTNSHIELRAAMEVLTLLQKRVIIYKYYFGYTDVEIARDLSISRQAVNKIINRAITKLKTQLL